MTYVHIPLTIRLPCETPMRFTLRLHQRFPVHCAVTYHAGAFLKLR
jgi:hypothetical protein